MSCNSKFQSPRFKIVDLFSLSNALKTIKKQSKIVHCFASLVFNGSLGLQLISFRHPTTRNYCTHEKSMPCKDILTFKHSFPQCLKIAEKVSFNIASEASYVFIFLSGKKTMKICQNAQFWRVFESLSLWSNSVTRQVTFNRTKVGEKCQI